jgi:hypothetical protein
MRIIELESNDLPFDFNVWNTLGMTSDRQRAFERVFEQDLLAALESIKPSSDGPEYRLAAGIPVRTVQQEGLWTSYYGPTYEDARKGEPMLCGDIFVWVLWQVPAAIRSSRSNHEDRSELLARVSISQAYSAYEGFPAEKVAELSRYLYHMGVNKGFRQRIDAYAGAAADAQENMLRFAERRRVLKSLLGVQGVDV